MASTELTYRSYQGSIEVSIDDACLHGRVLFIDDLITYDGNTVDEIKISFQDAVDRYIDHCANTGKPPNKPYSGSFNVRIGPVRHRLVAQLAYKNKTSINVVVCNAIDVLQHQYQNLLTTKLTNDTFLSRVAYWSDDSIKEVNLSVSASSAASMGRFNFSDVHTIGGNC